jgi:hypothetical protein
MAQQAITNRKEILNVRINYHNRAADRQQAKVDSHQRMLDWHIQGAVTARKELVRIALIPLFVEYNDILGNLVARGNYDIESNEYVTNHGVKVAHWNASRGIIVPVPSVRNKVRSQNIRADPVTHERVKEQQRERYRATHPVVQRINRFLD